MEICIVCKQSDKILVANYGKVTVEKQNSKTPHIFYKRQH